MVQQAILVVGSLNMDQVVRVPRVPTLGETLLGAGSLRLVPGGKGANQAVAIARLSKPVHETDAGAAVMMAGRVGKDPFGTQLLHALEADGVDTSLIAVDEQEASGVAFIFLTPEGNNSIVVASGANMQVGHDTTQFSQVTRAIPQARALVLQLEIPLETVKRLVAVAHAANVPVFLNLAPAQPLPQETLQHVSVLIVNETEASLLSGQRVETVEEAQSVATTLHTSGIATVVITLGAQGALMVTADKDGGIRHFHQPAPAIQVVDSTAAGDCFAGALVVALSEGRSPEEALRFAVTASAVKVTKFGAQSGLPTREEVESLLHRL